MIEIQSAKRKTKDDLRDRIKTIGIPRGLLWYKYGIFWKTFFENLGFSVVESPETNRAIFDEGEYLSSDEVCLASKAYLGHVAAIKDQCDTVFVPCHDSCDVRAGFCTKYQSLPDMVKATFRDKQLNVLTLRIPEAKDQRKTRASYTEFATKTLGASPSEASKAWKTAIKAQRANEREKALAQDKSLKEIARSKAGSSKRTAGEEELVILLMAHPYISHDDYIAGDIVRSIESMGAKVVFADETDHDATFKKSFDFSSTLPWIINRELVGSLMLNKHRIDGVILLSAFPCGPDSMFDDAIMRRFPDVPMLNLMIDSLSGTAGVQTRIESFIDILRFKKKGSYLGQNI